ncbi:GDCCVxC domain-containing (seleno)protein [Cupriavidus sp. WKF15]|uniref:GDCCVxC domain-containing (seleno)protein n=1 Tax=Cupriavidus sp. WKF15 TaxID=3032282 RepID=UPI0023E26CD3|nr:GDCCVxC domain-containing (seleno)protein [Cupriavidus sp. WKF15]WER49280.1 GDCCVxC domain-containing (seleno)protein [Cupriavidus sp. WKF15]
MSAVKLKSIITCPKCAYAKEDTMPTDACQWCYECERCHMLLRPKAGDCCVFCSYGTERCPPMQQQTGLCCSPAAVTRR